MARTENFLLETTPYFIGAISGSVDATAVPDQILSTVTMQARNPNTGNAVVEPAQQQVLGQAASLDSCPRVIASGFRTSGTGNSPVTRLGFFRSGAQTSEWVMELGVIGAAAPILTTGVLPPQFANEDASPGINDLLRVEARADGTGVAQDLIITILMVPAAIGSGHRGSPQRGNLLSGPGYY